MIANPPTTLATTVSRADLEKLLLHLQETVDDPRAGLFGPESLVWQINREALLFLGGGRAALLQLAHPYVAEAIDQHSDTRDNPFGRFHRTFRNVFTMVYGDLDSAFTAARHVHRVHTHIRGELSETLGRFERGQPYRANEPPALLWVHATLWETSILVFELLVRALSDEEKERYYRETYRFAHLFGIEEEVLPPTWRDFERYNREMWQQLVVGRSAREIGSFLFRPHIVGTGLVMRWLEIMTAGIMPDNLRRDFGLRFGRTRRAIFWLSVRLLRVTHRLWPKRVRFVPPYIEGMRRAAGDTRRDRLGEWLMRLWLGSGP